MNNNNQRNKKTARKEKMAFAAEKERILAGKTKEQIQEEVNVAGTTIESLVALRDIVEAAYGPDGNHPLDEAATKDLNDGFHSALERAKKQWSVGLAQLTTLTVVEKQEEEHFDNNHNNFDDEFDGAGGGGMAV